MALENKAKLEVFRRSAILGFIAVAVFLSGCDQSTTSTPVKKEKAKSNASSASPNASLVLTENWELSEADATLYKTIKEVGNSSREFVKIDFDNAVARNLKCDDILPNQGAYYGAPVMFAGYCNAIHQIDFDNGKATVAGMLALSDGTCRDRLIFAICPTKPIIKNGDMGVIVGYLGSRSAKLPDRDFDMVVVIARAILSVDQARKYNLRR